MSFHLASGPGVAAVTVFAITFALTARATSPLVHRASAAVGFLALIPLFLLGAIWPSAFTLAALLALPAGVILLAAVARPSVLRDSKTLVYSLIAVFLSPACLLIETLWLLR